MAGDQAPAATPTASDELISLIDGYLRAHYGREVRFAVVTWDHTMANWASNIEARECCDILSIIVADLSGQLAAAPVVDLPHAH